MSPVRSLALVLFAAVAGPAVAQDAPYLFLDAQPDLPATSERTPEQRKRAFAQRPNQPAAYALYVRNGGANERTFKVTTTLAGVAPVTLTVAGETTAAVKLVAPPPPAPGTTPKPADAALTFTLTDNRDTALDTYSPTLAAVLPGDYLRVVPRFTPASETTPNRFAVAVTANGNTPGTGPVKLTLSLADADPILAGPPGESTREANALAGQSATLYASGLTRAAGVPAKGVFAVGADGYARAFRYESDLTGTAPVLLSTPAVRVRGRAAQKSDPTYPLTLEVDNAPADGKLVFEFDAANDGSFQYKQPLNPLRDRRTRAAVTADGRVELQAAVADHAVVLPVAGVAGRRGVRLVLTDAAGVLLAKDERTIAVDDTPPTVTMKVPAAAEPPQEYKRGTPIPAEAAVADPESGVKRVQFWATTQLDLGTKPPPGTQFYPAAVRNGVATAAVTLPRAWKDRVRFGVRVENNADLVEDRDGIIVITEADVAAAAATKKGTVKGKVVFNDLAQPKLPVTLLNAATRKEVAAGTTDAKGEFTFADVDEGSYRVRAERTAEAGEAAAAVTAGKTTTVDVKLSRTPQRSGKGKQ